MKKYWLLFAQGVTIGLAVLFVLATLRPEWLPAPLSPAPGHVDRRQSVAQLLVEVDVAGHHGARLQACRRVQQSDEQGEAVVRRRVGVDHQVAGCVCGDGAHGAAPVKKN